MHIAGELVGRYLKERPAYNVIALSANPAVLTAWANDYEYETVFSRQVEAHAQKGGVLIGISTSRNSKNVVKAMEVARERGMAVVALTGKGGELCARQPTSLSTFRRNLRPAYRKCISASITTCANVLKQR